MCTAVRNAPPLYFPASGSSHLLTPPSSGPPCLQTVELKNNIKQRWWRDMVHGREDVVGLDSSIIASPKVRLFEPPHPGDR
jgi:hypothetical protein